MRTHRSAWLTWVCILCAIGGLLTLAWARGHKQDAKDAAKKAIKAFFGKQNSVPTPNARLLANLTDNRLQESSGLTVSMRNPDILWTHNDSGDGPYLYAIDKKGRTLARFTVTGAVNVDWEDLAIGPGANGKPALYIGDTGDNDRRRTNTVVYRVEEPIVETGKTMQQGRTLPAEKLVYHFPDGSHDCETLLVHPRTGEILLVTKEANGNSAVFAFPKPLQTGKQMFLTKIGEIHFANAFFRGDNRFARGERMATGGAISPDGRYLVVRTYVSAYEWAIPDGKPIAETFRKAPRQVVLPLTKQGESVCYRPDSKAWFMTSEQSPVPLYELTVR